MHIDSDLGSLLDNKEVQLHADHILHLPAQVLVTQFDNFLLLH